MDIKAIRSEFPILQRTVYGKPLIYLDNAASSQTPRRVVEAIDRAYYTRKANVHRGVHCLSQEATEAMEHSLITAEQMCLCLRRLNNLLTLIDRDKFDRLQAHLNLRNL